MRHIESRVLALVALGAAGPSRDDEAHLAGCVRCAKHRRETKSVTKLARAAADAGALLSPRPDVWCAIRAELGLDPGVPPPDTGAGRRYWRAHAMVLSQAARPRHVRLVVTDASGTAIARQRADGNPAHPGESCVRGPLV